MRPLGSGLVAMAGLFGSILPAMAQSAPVVSQPVVQQTAASDGRTLNEALARLARNPRDSAALIDAGKAALAMGDVDAAVGFFRRADQITPGNPVVKAGLAGAMVRSGDPFGAIPLYSEAERSGALAAEYQADRGLAYDLVGDNASAQRYYRQVLARGPNDEVSRRLALSLAVAGDQGGSEVALAPLLQKQDKAAWRTRAFTLAIIGRSDEAVRTAQAILPADLAKSIAPYLRYMPRLTPAQQVAAANFGQFPRASEIGIDDPRVAQFAPPRAVAAAAQQAGKADSRSARQRGRNANRRDRQQPAQAVAASPVSRVAVAAAPTAVVVPSSPPSTGTIQPAPVAVAAQPALSPMAQPVAPAPVPAPKPGIIARPPVLVAAAPTPSAPAPAPGFSLPPVSTQSAPAPTLRQSAPTTPQPVAALPATPAPAPAAPPVQVAIAPAPPPAASPPPRPRSLSEAFAEFAQPSADATPAAGAVDIRRIRAARPAPAPAANQPANQPAKPAATDAKRANAKAEPAKKARPPAPPAHPSRIWVQVATGRDKAALAFDWRRFVREDAAVFRGKQPFVSAWGRTNRLLTGPFPTEAAANTYIGQLRRAGVDGAFVWTSEVGQAVDALPGK